VPNKKQRLPTLPRHLIVSTSKAYDLLESGQTAKALEILEELNSKYPDRAEVLGLLVNAYFDVHDQHHYEYAIRQLSRLERGNADLHYALAGAFLVNDRPVLALRAFQEALRRWPVHPKAEEARKLLPLLENGIREETAGVNLTEAEAFDMMFQHDELRYCLAHAEYRQGKLVAKKLLNRFPDFVPALNNLGQIYAVEGDIDQAIQTSLHVLQIEPENIHALSNLARLYFLGGHPKEAFEVAERLKRSHSDAADRWTKIAEALTFLEDDEGVLAVYEQAKAAGQLEPPFSNEIFFHLLAAAACNLGKEKKARDFWEKALKINPNFDWAKENLADLKKPADERNGAWSYPFENWLLGPVVLDLSKQLQKVKRTSEKSEMQAAFSNLFEEKHPEIFFLAPHLLERGDSKAREFVFQMAAITGHVVLLETVKSYIFGKKGSFEERFKASKILSEADLLPSGSVRMWSKGQWREVMLLNMNITQEPQTTNRPMKVQELAEQASFALQEQDGQRAQSLLEQAINLWPDDPSLQNNLGKAYEMQGQSAKAFQMVRDIHAKYPGYFFGIIGVAGLAVINSDLEQAHKLLNDLMKRKDFHISEFIALCNGQIQVWLAEKNYEAARTWLGMWEKVDPDNPALNPFRLRVGMPEKYGPANLLDSIRRKR
jgi:tetratricopeptide (TPR) repeat protein